MVTAPLLRLQSPSRWNDHDPPQYHSCVLMDSAARCVKTGASPVVVFRDEDFGDDGDDIVWEFGKLSVLLDMALS